MDNLLVAIAFAAVSASASKPMPVQYTNAGPGLNVMISLDGRAAHNGFAGKLAFRDQNRSWASVCADVRAPIRNGDAYLVRPMSTSKFGGRITMAGNIVAKYFNAAQTPAQCAALQLAVWEAIEDGGEHANFRAGRFMVKAPQGVLDLAQDFYEAQREADEATYLQTGQGGGQGQISTT